MLAAYVKRGVMAGIVAGLVFGLFVALVANPLVAFADELGHDAQHAVGDDHGAADHHHDTAVPSTVEHGVSVVSGVLWGILLGGVVFGFAYYFLEPAIPETGGTKSYLLAAAGFVTVSGSPWLVLPPQLPGVEQAAAPETRIALYAGMMILGAAACLLSGYAYDRLRAVRGRAVAVAAAAIPFGLLAVPVLLSPVEPASHSLPPELAAGLTGMTVFGQVLLWLLLAGTHARLQAGSTADRTADATSRHTETTITAD